MRTDHKAAFAAIACSIFIFVSPAQAQRQGPPKPDLAKMATSIDVPEFALKSCMGERPEDGSTEGRRPPQPDAAKISACLKKAGHKISEQSVKDTLAAFGPPGRPK